MDGAPKSSVKVTVPERREKREERSGEIGEEEKRREKREREEGEERHVLSSTRVHPHVYPPPPHASPSLFLFPSSCLSLPLHMVEACRGSYTYTRVHTHTHIHIYTCTYTYTYTHVPLYPLYPSFPSLPVGLDQEGTVLDDTVNQRYVGDPLDFAFST